VENRYRKTWL